MIYSSVVVFSNNIWHYSTFCATVEYISRYFTFAIFVMYGSTSQLSGKLVLRAYKGGKLTPVLPSVFPSVASVTRMFVLALNWYFIYTVALLFGLWFSVKHIFSARVRVPLPPGPPGHWLFGNKLPTSR